MRDTARARARHVANRAADIARRYAPFLALGYVEYVLALSIFLIRSPDEFIQDAQSVLVFAAVLPRSHFIAFGVAAVNIWLYRHARQNAMERGDDS